MKVDTVEEWVEVGVGPDVGGEVGKEVAGKSNIPFPNHDALNTVVGTLADCHRTVTA
jgi:hypothetical protein